MGFILFALAAGALSLYGHSPVGLVFAGISLVAAVIRWIAKG